MPIFLPALAIALQTANTPTLVPLDQVRIEEYKKIQNVRDKILAADPYAGLVPNALDTDPAIQAMGLTGKPGKDQISQALGYQFDTGVLQDLRPLDLSASDPVLDYTIARTDANGSPVFTTIRKGLKDVPLAIYKVKATETPTTADAGPKPAPQQREVFVGIIDRPDLDNTLAFGKKNQHTPGLTIDTQIEDSTAIPVHLYENSHKQIFAVLDHEPSQPLIFPERPEFIIFNKSPEIVDAAYKKKDLSSLGVQEISWAVKEADGIVSMEHVRRAEYLKLQHLRDKVASQNPTTGDFPPQMLQTDEFKQSGLNLQDQLDRTIFFQALTFKPEGATLDGYHPMDFGKDKAAQYTAIIQANFSGFSVQTFKQAFEGKKLFLFKIKAEPTGKDAAGGPVETYYGPATLDTLEAIKKSKPDMKISDLKDQDIPLSIYTNDKGSIVFVMAFRPKDVLLVPAQPAMVVSTDPVEKLAPISQDLQKAMRILQEAPKVSVTYAIQEN